MAEANIQFGIVAAALTDDPRQAARLAREAGFAGVQFEAVSPSLSLPDLSQSGRREFRRVLAAEDQQLAGLRSRLGPKGFGPGADIDRLLTQLQRAMEAAAGLAAPLLGVDLGPLPPAPKAPGPRPAVKPEQAGLIIIPSATAQPAPEPAEPPPSPPDPAFVSQVDSAMSELGRLADRYSVTVALRSDLAGFAAIAQALRRANCPWFGIDMDPVAILRDEWDVDEVLSQLSPLIRHVRGRDATLGADRRTQPAIVGRGSTDWGQLLSNLDAAGYRGWLTVDPIELTDRRAAAAQALAHLRSLIH